MSKLVLPDTVERQVAAALASTKAAEAKRLAAQAAKAKEVEAVKAPTPTLVPTFDLAAAIETMPDAFLQCRDFRHSWSPLTARWMAAAHCYEQVLRCQRCGTDRLRKISTRGEVLESSYAYAENYVLKGLGRTTGTIGDDIRLASIRSIIDKGKK